MKRIDLSSARGLFGEALSSAPEHGSTRWTFRVPPALSRFIAAKGSITLDGVSLTVNEVTDDADGTTHFAVNIIPHTAEHTTLGKLASGQQLNIEIDVLARYLSRMEAYRARTATA